MHLNEPTGGIQQAAGEHHVAHDLAGVDGDQREPVVRGHRLAESVDKVGHDLAVIVERRQV